MQDLPHHYRVSAKAQTESDVAIESESLPALVTAPPAEFGGPGNRWSPETLLVASVADCFILTFRAIARNSKVEWLELSCSAEGELDRLDRVTQFTAFTVNATLRIPPHTDEKKAARLLELAEKSCLVTNSFKASTHLDYTIETLSP